MVTASVEIQAECTLINKTAAQQWFSVLQGDVLEISAGTGRNLGYYKWKALKSLTLTDTSRHMLYYAR